jgi:single-stranded DNA-specific DHH superfamily exonuclease
MSKGEANLSKVGNLQEEIEILKQENISLKNQLDNHLLKNTAFKNATESERKQIILYLEEVSQRIHGIPAISNIIKDVIGKIASAINNGDHLKQETYNRR